MAWERSLAATAALKTGSPGDTGEKVFCHVRAVWGEAEATERRARAGCGVRGRPWAEAQPVRPEPGASSDAEAASLKSVIYMAVRGTGKRLFNVEIK